MRISWNAEMQDGRIQVEYRSPGLPSIHREYDIPKNPGETSAILASNAPVSEFERMKAIKEGGHLKGEIKTTDDTTQLNLLLG